MSEELAYAQRAYDDAWDDTDRDPKQAWRIELWDTYMRMLREADSA